MADEMTGGAARADDEGVHDHGHAGQKATVKLVVGAIGIVFGDIGTSPLYAFRETFAGHHHLELDPDHILGVISLMFWRSEEHTSELQSLMRISYAVFCLKTKKKHHERNHITTGI